MLEILTVGAKVKTAFETTAGQRPTGGYTVLPDVSEAPSQDLSLETIDVSNIMDKITRYGEGRQDPGGDQAFTLNHTDNVIDVWNALAAEAEIKKAQGKRLWFEYAYPGANKSYYWAGTPKKLGTSGIAQNSASTLQAHAVLTDWVGWAAKSASITADETAISITGTGTDTVTISNAAGNVKAESSNTSVCTVSGSGTSFTITGVAAGTSVVTFTDANEDVATVIVTVSASA